MKKRVIFLASLLILQGAAGSEEMRIWTSKKGDTVEAAYMRLFAGGKVVLITPEGRELRVPIDALSDEDQAYLASLVPPKLDIDIDVDIDTDTKYSTYSHDEKSDTAKCTVTVKKTNKEPCNRTFTANIYLFAKTQRGDDYWVISQEEAVFPITGECDEFFFKCPAATVEFTDSAYTDRRGYRYEGYLLIIEDEAGEMIAVESNRGELESHWKAIKGARKGTQFDEDFDQLTQKRSKSFE
jgi:hypothetical protein